MRFSNSRPLTAAAILAAGDGDHSDAAVPGLVLRVRGAAASWVYRFSSPTRKRIDKHGRALAARREIGLGSACRDSLEAAEAAAVAARAKALQYASAVMLGRDPADERIAERAARRDAAAAQAKKLQRERRTLGAVIRLYHEREVEGSGAFADKYCAQWIAAFENHLKPFERGALWARPIDEIEAQHLLEFIKALQKKLPHTARKVRQRLDAVFEYACLKKWCAGNPTMAIVRAVRRGAPSLKNKSHRALPHAQAPALMARLRALDSTASRCLQFAVLTAARTNEAINAEWSEIDLAAGTWVVSADKMKAGEEHRVDLPRQAIDILEKQQGLSERWVFPSPMGTDRPMSNTAMLLCLRRLKVQQLTTVHGLARGTFSTWANETGAARPDVIEAALAHREADLIRAAYNKAQFLAERRLLLQAWADYLDDKAPARNVVEFAAARVAA